MSNIQPTRCPGDGKQHLIDAHGIYESDGCRPSPPPTTTVPATPGEDDQRDEPEDKDDVTYIFCETLEEHIPETDTCPEAPEDDCDVDPLAAGCDEEEEPAREPDPDPPKTEYCLHTGTYLTPEECERKGCELDMVPC